MWSNISEEHITSIFSVESQLSKKLVCRRWLGSYIYPLAKSLLFWAQLLATISSPNDRPSIYCSTNLSYLCPGDIAMHNCVDKIHFTQSMFPGGHDSMSWMRRFTHEECAGGVKYGLITTCLTCTIELSDQMTIQNKL
jgi:hypothetical protein